MSKIVQKFKVDGKEVIFRCTEVKDAEAIFLMHTSLHKEKAMTAMNEKPKLKEVKEKLKNRIEKAKNKQMIDFVVEIEGKVRGRAMVFKSEKRAQGHIGTLGIHLDKETRGKGIGSKLIDVAIKEAKEVLKIKMITLEVMAQNKGAIKLYKRKGFDKYGKLDRGIEHYGKLVDIILMVKYF